MKEKESAKKGAPGKVASDVSQGKQPSAKNLGQQKHVTSAKSTGASAVSFEHRVQTMRLLAMCLDTPCPGIPEGFSIVKISFQVRVLGHNTDDLVLMIASLAGDTGTV